MKCSILYNAAEVIISMIKANCNNPDDLSKIASAIESLLEHSEQLKNTISPTTLRQILLQAGEKVE